MRLPLAFSLALLFFVTAAAAREFTVLVYNVENLAAADGRTLSEDYRPKRYSRLHLLTKLNNIAKVCAQLNEGRGPEIIIFQEIERDITADQYTFDHAGMMAHYAGTRIEDMLGRDYNREIARLPVEALLLKTLADRGMTGYRVAAADDGMEAGPRRRIAHLNVVFTRFVIGAVQTFVLPDAPAILEVQVEIDDKPLYLFNNDWRSGFSDAGAEKSRVAAAKILRERLDEILGVNPNADMIIAGDFNCFHDQKHRYAWRRTAMNDVLRSQSDELLLRGRTADLYNLWYELAPAQRGSELIQGEWTTFMQMIVSRGLYDFRGVQYVDNSFGIAAYEKLNALPTGEPYRWSFKGIGEGYSEHFPIYAQFKTVKTNRPDQYLSLRDRGAVADGK